MKVKTNELSGRALDWAVAKCEGYKPHAAASLVILGSFAPSTDWAQGGPIIEREGINTFRYNKLDQDKPWVWCAHKAIPRPNMEGSTNMVAVAIDGLTPLIAGMRCYVASKLGDEIDIPDELSP